VNKVENVASSSTGDSWPMDITTGDDFLGLCDQKSSHEHVSNFGWLGSFGPLKLRIEGKDYWRQK